MKTKKSVSSGTKKNAGKVLAVIPARGNSKGVRRKNIRDICGKPLIYYQIRNALESKLIHRVIFATDDALIAKIAKDLFGNQIQIVMRPPEISTDVSKTEETLEHVLKCMGKEAETFSIVVTLEPTNPLNRPEYIDECIRLIERENYDSACCVIEDYVFFLDSDEGLQQAKERPMRQNLKPRIRETGNVWVTKKGVLLKEKDRLGGRVGFIKIPRCDSCHLDSEDDWRVIESFLRLRQFAREGKYFKTRFSKKTDILYEEKYWGKIIDPDGAARDRKKERTKRIKECKQEIDYINTLKPGKILDVGCGLGFLLSAVKKTWDKYGVEISAYATERAQKYAAVYCGNLKDARYESDFFDVVVLYHVIEHLHDPIGELIEVKRILKPGGKLIVATPDFGCGLAQKFGKNFRLLHDKGHISLFSSLGLYQLLVDLFFEVERVWYPFFETEHFTKKNLLRLFDTKKISPPFYGNVMTFYAYKK